jgi:hypothetical protein
MVLRHRRGQVFELELRGVHLAGFRRVTGRQLATSTSGSPLWPLAPAYSDDSRAGITKTPQSVKPSSTAMSGSC